MAGRIEAGGGKREWGNGRASGAAPKRHGRRSACSEAESLIFLPDGERQDPTSLPSRLVRAIFCPVVSAGRCSARGGLPGGEAALEWNTTLTGVGAALAVVGLLSFALDVLTLPKVRVALGEWTDAVHFTPPIRFWHVTVHNEPTPSPVRWFRRRQFACGADVAVTIWKVGATLPSLSGVEARWNATPEPLHYWWDPTTGTLMSRPDLGQALANRTLPQLVPREGGYAVAFLSKRDGETDCYLFNDMAYQHPDTAKTRQFQNPAWRIASGNYYIKVSVIWADRGTHETWFKLDITGPALYDVKLELLPHNPLDQRA